MRKRFLAIFSAAVMFISIPGCSLSTSDQAAKNVPVFSEPVSISILFPRGDKLFDRDWLVWDYIRSATGAELDLRQAGANYESSLATAFASPQTMPDLVAFNSKALSDKYASSGSLVALEDVQEQMPNWAIFWSNISAEERERLFRVRRYADGKTYWPARYGFADFSNIKAWMYRKDIFDQHGLDIPSTYDEMYDVAKRLKELYPSSYPISCENFFTHVAQAVGPQWKRNFQCWEYYDFSSAKWCYGAAESTMLDIIKTFNRFYEDDLIYPSFTASTEHEFTELVTGGNTFMFPHFQSRMEDFISEASYINRFFELAVMTPPVANTRTGSHFMINTRADNNGLSIVNTRDASRIANAVKFFDWFYSSSAVELLSWGKVGETHENLDGKKHFILSSGEDIRSKYGLHTPAAAQAVNPESVISYRFKFNSGEDVKTLLSSIESDYNPRNWISFTSDEAETVSKTGSAIRSFARDSISKFLLGQKPLSEWDSFTQELYDMGLTELLSAYERAYNRVK